MNVLKLKAAMVEHGISTEKLAEAIGIHPATMYRKLAVEANLSPSVRPKQSQKNCT